MSNFEKLQFLNDKIEQNINFVKFPKYDLLPILTCRTRNSATIKPFATMHNLLTATFLDRCTYLEFLLLKIVFFCEKMLQSSLFEVQKHNLHQKKAKLNHYC